MNIVASTTGPQEASADDVGVRAAQREQAERDLHAAVVGARARGRTWAQIGAALGTTAGAARMAHQRATTTAIAAAA